MLEGRFDLGFGACGRHSPYLNYDDLFEERQVLYCGRGHPLFERSGDVSVSDLKGQQFVRRAYAAPNKLPSGVRLSSTAVADLMESVAVFILSGRYIGFLPTHFAQQWVAQDLMRPLLEQHARLPEPDLSGAAQDRAEEADPGGVPGRAAECPPRHRGAGAGEEAAQSGGVNVPDASMPQDLAQERPRPLALGR